MQLFCKIVFLVSCSDGFSDTEDNFQSRAGKFLNFFQIVTFKNQPCATQDGSEESGGVCYSPWECRRGGIVPRGLAGVGSLRIQMISRFYSLP